MPVDYYPNKSVAELVTILEKLQDRQTKGVLSTVAAAGTRVDLNIGRGTGNSRSETEILRVMYSLFVRASGTDQAAQWPNPYLQKITRVRARYTFS